MCVRLREKNGRPLGVVLCSEICRHEIPSAACGFTMPLLNHLLSHSDVVYSDSLWLVMTASTNLFMFECNKVSFFSCHLQFQPGCSKRLQTCFPDWSEAKVWGRSLPAHQQTKGDGFIFFGRLNYCNWLLSFNNFQIRHVVVFSLCNVCFSWLPVGDGLQRTVSNLGDSWGEASDGASQPHWSANRHPHFHGFSF